MQQVAIASASVFFLLTVGLVVLTASVAHTLKSRFPAVWSAEGEPEEWLWLRPASRSRHIFDFLEERRYLATGNLNYSRLCAAVRLGWYMFFALFLLAMLVAAIAVVATGWHVA